MTKQETINIMSEFLIKRAESRNVSLRGLNLVNYNSFLENAFKDGGKTRQKFIDYATKYSIEQGGSKEKDTKQIVCIEGALEIVIEHVYQQERKRREVYKQSLVGK